MNYATLIAALLSSSIDQASLQLVPSQFIVLRKISKTIESAASSTEPWWGIKTNLSSSEEAKLNGCYFSVPMVAG